MRWQAQLLSWHRLYNTDLRLETPFRAIGASGGDVTVFHGLFYRKKTSDACHGWSALELTGGGVVSRLTALFRILNSRLNNWRYI